MCPNGRSYSLAGLFWRLLIAPAAREEPLTLIHRLLCLSSFVDHIVMSARVTLLRCVFSCVQFKRRSTRSRATEDAQASFPDERINNRVTTVQRHRPCSVARRSRRPFRVRVNDRARFVFFRRN